MALQLLVLYSGIVKHHKGLDAEDFAVRMHHAHRMRDTSFPVEQSVSSSRRTQPAKPFRLLQPADCAAFVHGTRNRLLRNDVKF